MKKTIALVLTITLVLATLTISTTALSENMDGLLVEAASLVASVDDVVDVDNMLGQYYGDVHENTEAGQILEQQCSKMVVITDDVEELDSLYLTMSDRDKVGQKLEVAVLEDWNTSEDIAELYRLWEIESGIIGNERGCAKILEMMDKVESPKDISLLREMAMYWDLPQEQINQLDQKLSLIIKRERTELLREDDVVELHNLYNISRFVSSYSYNIKDYLFAAIVVKMSKGNLTPDEYLQLYESLPEGEEALQEGLTKAINNSISEELILNTNITSERWYQLYQITIYRGLSLKVEDTVLKGLLEAISIESANLANDDAEGFWALQCRTPYGEEGEAIDAKLSEKLEKAVSLQLAEKQTRDGYYRLYEIAPYGCLKTTAWIKSKQ